jgi:hypothetical protein
MEMAKIARVDSEVRIKLDRTMVRVEGDGDGNPELVFEGIEFGPIEAPFFRDELFDWCHERKINMELVHEAVAAEVKRQQIIGLITDAIMR